MTGNEILYLSHGDVEACAVPFERVREVVHATLAQKGLGNVESPPKRGIVPRRDSSMRAMQAHVPARGAAGIKWISAFPGNVEVGLPTIHGLVLLNDVSTGIPIAVMDCAWITAARTAACTSVAAAYLARRQSATLGIVACGTQGRANLRALCADFPITHVKCCDLEHERAERFAAEMGAELGVAVTVVRAIREAVAECDIVVTSTPIRKNPRPAVGAGVLASGCFACALDYDATFSGEALREADKLVTDDTAQLNFFREIGYFQETPEPDADLGKIAACRQPGREARDERIVCMNLGIACLDIAVADLVYVAAVEAGLGMQLPVHGLSKVGATV